MKYKCSTCSWIGGEFSSQSSAKNAHDAYNISSEEMCSSTPKQISENTMKKSQLKQLIREVIQESAMSNLHLEITESIEGLIELGATYKDIRTVIDQLEEESKQEPESYDKSGFPRWETSRLRMSLRELEEESKQEPESYDKSGKPSTGGSFDVGGKYDPTNDIEKAEYEEDRASKLSERIKNINESLDNNIGRTAFFNAFKEINDGSLAAMDVANSKGPKVYKGINLDKLWSSLVMNSGSKSFDGDVDIEKTYNAYSRLEEGFFDRLDSIM